MSGDETSGVLATLEHIDQRVSTLERAHAGLAARVSDIGDRVEGRDTEEAMELVAIKARLRRLEER